MIQEIVPGQRLVPREILEKAVRRWPVNERAFFPLHDDAPDGVVVVRKSQSVQSSRVFQRGGYDYYEYRDTAMSHVAMIRPEWIKMLHAVGDNDPGNPSVQWNNGHFLYQFTYFVGPVNCYYAWNGRRFCASMNTGDSLFGLPFAEHSFASRNPQEHALILALTFGGRLVGDAQHELGVLGNRVAEKYAFPSHTHQVAQASLLRMHMDNGSYSCSFLADAAGIGLPRLKQLLHADAAATPDELHTLARVFACRCES